MISIDNISNARCEKLFAAMFVCTFTTAYAFVNTAGESTLKLKQKQPCRVLGSMLLKVISPNSSNLLSINMRVYCYSFGESR